MYRGTHTDLLILLAAKSTKRLAYAVIVRDFDPKHTQYVPTPLLSATEPRTLNKVTVELALNNCVGDLSLVNTKIDLAWTPACYFGGSGSYKNHSLLFYINGADCEKSIDDAPFRFDGLKCQNLKNALPAVGEFVEFELSSTQQNNKRFNTLLRVISDIVLWDAWKP